jgi:branched-chain amino acid aminotransferase
MAALSDTRRPGPRRPADYPAMVGGRLCTVGEATVPASDDGLLRGDGAFEYVRAYLGRPFTLTEHLERLERSCATIRLAWNRDELERDIAGVVAALATESFDLRLVLTRGGQRIVLAEPIPSLLERLRLAFVVDTPRRVVGGAKTLSYAGNMLAKRLAVERGFDEALLVTPRGRVLEVQNAAFFYVARDGALCTPPLTRDILDSITRRVLMRRLEVEERPCTRRDALECREAFAAGAGREIQPVGALEDHAFDEVPGPLTRAAETAYWDEVEATTGVARKAYLASRRLRP